MLIRRESDMIFIAFQRNGYAAARVWAIRGPILINVTSYRPLKKHIFYLRYIIYTIIANILLS